MNSQQRYRARRLAVQSLYAWQLAHDPIDTVIQQSLTHGQTKQIDQEYYVKLVKGVVIHQAELDATIEPHLQRPLADVDPIELAIARLSCFELLYCQDVPYRVVIDQGLELAKLFGSEKSHAFINSILDRIAKTVQANE